MGKRIMTLTDKALLIGDWTVDFKSIETASVIAGKHLSLTIDGNSYKITGGNRFNPLKYVFMFNKLDTTMHLKNTDVYFNLEEN